MMTIIVNNYYVQNINSIKKNNNIQLPIHIYIYLFILLYSKILNYILTILDIKNHTYILSFK